MHYFVGWDVGGWNCDKNPNSRDALAVLTVNDAGDLSVVGQVARGNIRHDINCLRDLASLINTRCGTQIRPADEIVLAIDTPLGLPAAIGELLGGRFFNDDIPDDYSRNPYLYRQTEQWLFRRGFSPLSAIKDMIGSQATKGIHLLRKLQLHANQCGIWANDNVTAIETYPTPCRESATLMKCFEALRVAVATQDRIDAVVCALVAYLFVADRNQLVAPVDDPPLSEGWIWIPADAIGND
ncbi:hypothetical protein [Planctellipticum variicoloris]|uniref:hypothetical protein n=1 Tax=Planctellipticum variicoloris TaxID=3064265 RepID=UPI0030138E4C|nr:DUF429 domain-containing protein [Planctomycetaceae bacterium SH412]